MLLPTHRADTSHIVLGTPAPTSHRTAEENLGIAYLAASLRKAGYQVTVIDAWLEGLTPLHMAQRIENLGNLLWVGFAAYRSNMPKAIETMHILRQRGMDLCFVAGGYGPTFHPDEFLDAGFDLVVRGEAETTVLDISVWLQAKENKKLDSIPGISFVRNGEKIHNPARPLDIELDALPIPARDTLEMSLKRKSAVHIMSSRGCASNCLFCSIVSFVRLSHGPQWRQRSISSFVDELESLSQQGVTCLKVVDDSFIEPPRDEIWCNQLADEIEHRGLKLRLRGSIRADRVTEPIISALKRAGFFSFSCGIENFSNTALFRMRKKATREDNIQTLELFAKYGMHMQAGHILFDAGTTLDELWENFQGMSNYVWTTSKGIFTEMYAAKGTPLTRLIERKNATTLAFDGLGNSSYPLKNAEVVPIYNALKKWHKAHMGIYDKTIDPLSAPKAISEESFQTFHQLGIELRQKDLAMMKRVLEETPKYMEALVEQEITKTQGWYATFEHLVDQAYQQAGLIYDAEENPFIG